MNRTTHMLCRISSLSIKFFSQSTHLVVVGVFELEVTDQQVRVTENRHNSDTVTLRPTDLYGLSLKN